MEQIEAFDEASSERLIIYRVVQGLQLAREGLRLRAVSSINVDMA